MAEELKQFEPNGTYLVGGAILNELIRVASGLRPFLDIRSNSLQIDKGTNLVKIEVKTTGGIDFNKVSTTVLQTCDGPVTVLTLSS